jgi:hypothetical protein
MATTTRTRASNSTKRKTSTPRQAAASRANGRAHKASGSTIAEGYAGGFLQAVRARPYAAAAIAAGAAGASAFLWAKRAIISDQASAAGAKLGEFRSQASDQATALKDKVSERFFASDGDNATTDGMSTRRSKRAQSDISVEALSLKQIGEPIVAKQSKIGAVAY